MLVQKLTIAICAIFFAGCHSSGQNNFYNSNTGKMSTMRVTSTAFKEGEMIPVIYTCKGKDINPPIQIADIPKETKSLALILEDPDAPMGTWVHWVMWNISPATREIAENSVPAGAVQGKNSWGKKEYGGPCPPSGVHRYFIKVYALDTLLTLSPSSREKDLEKAMQGHVITEGQLMGRAKK